MAEAKKPVDPTLEEQEKALQAQIAALAAKPIVQEIIEADEVAEEPTEVEPEAGVRVSTPRPPDVRRPTPESELTPEEKRLRELQDRLAREQARQLDSDAALAYEPPAAGEIIEFWIVKDGFSAWGQTWYRGQEVAVEVGSKAYEETFDRNGNTWLRFLENEFDQQVAFGDIEIRKGRWPGQGYEDPRAAAKEASRARRVPVISR